MLRPAFQPSGRRLTFFPAGTSNGANLPSSIEDFFQGVMP